jgi:hypothetical protein
MELDRMAAELAQCENVIDVDVSGEVVGLNVECGEYDCLTSEMLTILGRWDCELYAFPNEQYNDRFV